MTVKLADETGKELYTHRCDIEVSLQRFYIAKVASLSAECKSPGTQDRKGPENSHNAMRCNKTLQIYSKLNCLIFRTYVSRETVRYCTSYSDYQCIAAKGRRTALLFIVVPLPFPGASDHMFPLLFPGAMYHRVSLIL